MVAVSFRVGEQFPSFLSLQSKIEQYQSANKIQMYRRSSRCLAAAKSRCPNRVFKEEIKYWELYSCINGKKQFKARGTGARNQSCQVIYIYIYTGMTCDMILRCDKIHLMVKYLDFEFYTFSSSSMISDYNGMSTLLMCSILILI